MILSDYIKALQAIEAEHGDLEVETFFVDGSRRTAPKPEIDFRKILSPRQHKPAFWSATNPETKGQKVVRV